MSTMDTIRSGFVEAARVLEQFTNDRTAWEALEQAGRLMVETLRGGGKIITCGNGGSMCDAMHFAEELTGRFRGNRRALAAVALCDPTHITCVANDYGYDYIFSKGVEAVGRPGDLLLGITTSGNSRNVLEAVASARSIGMKVVALTGKGGGQIASSWNWGLPSAVRYWKIPDFGCVHEAMSEQRVAEGVENSHLIIRVRLSIIHEQWSM